MNSITDVLNSLYSDMITEYQKGNIPQSFILRPYFEWKEGKKGCTLTTHQLLSMRRAVESSRRLYERMYPNAWSSASFEVVDDPYKPYEGYGKDKRTVAYLDQIEEDLVDELILRTQ